jgi:hypothetical protein
MAVAQGAVAYDLIGGTAGVLTGTLAQKTLKWGQALTFAGATTNRLTWPTQTSSAWINAGTFSVSVLGSIVGSDFSPGSNTYPTLLKFASSGSHVGPGFENVSGNIFFCYVADNLTSVVGAVNLGNSANSNNLGFSGTNQPALYSWVVNGTSCACYINGVLIETLTVTHGAAVTAAIATANAAVGWGCGGAIQAWYVHNRPLDQSEIGQLAAYPWSMLQATASPDPFMFAGGSSSGSTGTSATTNANDTSSASGTTTIKGTSSTTNANDTSAASGTTKILGTSATTNANDTSTASGTTKIVGTSATTNANDTATASGSVGSAVSGTSATTNANDTSAASGTTKILGTSSTTNANDAGVATGTTTVKGSSATTNANDSASASGAAGSITGTVAYTNNNDTVAAFGSGGTAVASSGVRGKRRRVLIGEKSYYVTEPELGFLLQSMLEREVEVEPVVEKKKPKKVKAEPVVAEIPQAPKFSREIQRQEDRGNDWVAALMREIARRWLDEMDDEDVLLLLH